VAIGLDTSVVLRLLIGEPRAQAEAARRRIERALIAGEKVVVTDLVVAERFHALRHHYDVPQATALGRLQAFFNAGIVQVDPVGVAEALEHRAREDMEALEHRAREDMRVWSIA
jgi:predicted nucleic acid-binding protein